MALTAAPMARCMVNQGSGWASKQAASEDDDALVDTEEDYGESEAGDGVFGVETGSDG